MTLKFILGQLQESDLVFELLASLLLLIADFLFRGQHHFFSADLFGSQKVLLTTQFFFQLNAMHLQLLDAVLQQVFRLFSLFSYTFDLHT
jgi:hypothetical protein